MPFERVEEEAGVLEEREQREVDASAATRHAPCGSGRSSVRDDQQPGHVVERVEANISGRKRQSHHA